MGVTDILRRRPSEPMQQNAPSQPPAGYNSPIMLPGDRPDRETIEYMTENKNVPTHLKLRYWGYDEKSLSFGNNLKEDAEDMISKFNNMMSYQRQIDPNYKNNPDSILESRQLEMVVEVAARRSIAAEHKKSLLTAVSVSDIKQEVTQGQAKKGGIGSTVKNLIGIN